MVAVRIALVVSGWSHDPAVPIVIVLPAGRRVLNAITETGLVANIPRPGSFMATGIALVAGIWLPLQIL